MKSSNVLFVTIFKTVFFPSLCYKGNLKDVSSLYTYRSQIPKEYSFNYIYSVDSLTSSDDFLTFFMDFNLYTSRLYSLLIRLASDYIWDLAMITSTITWYEYLSKSGRYWLIPVQPSAMWMLYVCPSCSNKIFWNSSI